MFELLKLFFDIALLKKSPALIPTSLTLECLVVFIYLLINFLMHFMSTPWSQVLLQVSVNLVLIALVCKLALFWAKKPIRYRQTFTALIGVDALISLCAFPALATLGSPMLEGSVISLLAFFVFVILIIWHWLATGHIFHHALSESFIFGLGVALLYLMLSYQLHDLLFADISD